MAKAPKKSKKPKTAPPLGRARSKQPHDVVLPGMEQVRNVKLDNLCRQIAETRATQNQCRQDEAGYERAALVEMQRDKRKDAKGVFSYRHAGVELVRLIGDEKLRVRTSRDNATSEQAGDDDGTGQGPGSYPVEPIDE